MINSDFKIENICIGPDVSIKKAVQVLNEGHKRIALVVDPMMFLLGVVADSDIRRALLAGLSLEEPVSSIMVPKPVIATTGMSDPDLLELMTQTHCFELPVLNSQGQVVGLKTIQDVISSPTSMVAVIMAGGRGQRLQPLTDSIPKPLIEVGGKPIIFHLLDQLIEAGITKVFLAVNYKSEMIKHAVSGIEKYSLICEYLEEEEFLGTAGALSLLPGDIASPVLVLNGDLITGMDIGAMLRSHSTEKNSMTIALREYELSLPFGVAQIDNGQVSGIVEKPTHRFFVSAGVYIVSTEILSLVTKNKRFDMPDLINQACGSGKKVGSFAVFEYWRDVGEKSSLERAQLDFELKQGG